MQKKEDLQLLHKVESYVNKDGEKKQFSKYYVLINGIELALQPADNTVRQVLGQYYEKGGIA